MLGIFALVAASAEPHLVRHKDPITDREVVMAIWLDDEENALSVACAPATKDLRVAISVKRHSFGKTGLLNASWPIILRFDQSKSQTSDWTYDEHIAEQVSSGEVASFVRNTLTAKQVVFRAREDFGKGDQFDTSFNLGSDKSPVIEVVRACGASKAARRLTDIIK